MAAYVDDYGGHVAGGGYHPHQHLQQQHAGNGPVSITQRLRGNAGLSINVGDANRGRVSPSQQHQHQQQQQHDQYDYDGRYGYAEQDILEGEESPHGSDEEVAEQLQMRGGGQKQHYAYEEDLHGEQGLDHAEGEEEDLEDDAGSFSDSLSSSPSIPDEDIDFNLVYALHTFLATVDGQASVVKGDKLLLLDDSNSYWWLVRVLKTQAIGYIPAENIETPWERLARLNKHRNVDLTSATQQDVITGPTSTTAQTRFIGRIPPSQQPHPHESRHPYSKGIPASPSHKDHPRNISPEPERRPGSSKAKVVLFTAPTYYAHSATGMTTDDEEGYEGEEGEYDDEGMEVDEHEHERGGGFEDDEEEEEIDEGHQAGGEESEFSDEEGEPHHRSAAGSRTPEAQHGHANLHEELSGEVDGVLSPEDEEVAKREHWERERAAAMQAQQQAAAAEAQWAREKEQQQDLELQQQRSLSPQGQGQQGPRRPLSPHNLNAQQQLHPSSPHSSATSDLAQSPKRSLPPHLTVESDGISAAYSPTQRSPGRSPNGPSSSFDENDFASGPTKKLTATPPIARTDLSDDDHGAVFDPLADADMEAAPYELRYQSPGQVQQPLSPPTSAPVPLSPASSAPPQKVRGVDLVDPKDPRYHRMLQPTKQAGEDVLYERMVQQQQAQQQQQQQQQLQQSKRSLDGSSHGHGHDGDTSMGSMDTTGASSVLSEGSASSASNNKRASQAGGKDVGTEKKRKSGGGILGLFRKKDKKKNRTSSTAAEAQREDDPRSSEESLRASGGSRRSGSASPASPRASAERAASSTPTGPSSSSSSSKRDSMANTAESMFSTDAALRQQEVEAKQALYQQYGVQRAPGDVSNTMTPRNGGGVGVGVGMGIGGVNGLGVEPQARSSTGSNRNSLQLLTHPASVVGANGVLGSPSSGGGVGGSLAPPQRIRPGSLMGSPSIPGLEVPLLSVMRVFAGSNVDSEATFKTVLLNQSTTSADLVKQAMQRFRLTGADLTRDDFYLTVKEIDGEERALGDDEQPLGVFEELSERAGEDSTLPPSVKRSSIGSITSISSNLSLNPAITRLGMNDWSDDSAVKFYLNRRGGPSPLPLHDGPAPSSMAMEDNAPTPTIPQYGDGDSGSDQTSTPTLGNSPQFAGAAASPSLSSAVSTPPIASSTPNYRFAVRLLIHPSDLPDSVVFDPQSNAIIPKAVLLERQQRNGGFSDPANSGNVSPNAREKIIFFPRNANVSEVVEAALDRFGIVDGVVDGGDEVEDRISRRRSATRVKYSLAAEQNGKETLLNASSKLLEAYSAPPLFKAYDRSSKEFRRRSVDATLVLGSPSDVQPSDPVFILRRSAMRAGVSVGARGPLPQTIDELEERLQQRRDQEEEQEVLAGSSPETGKTSGPSQRDLIAAQRAAQRANQRAILSAQKNSDQGIDINIPEHGTIRSARQADNDEVRYSFINQDGTEVDISEIVENEWSTRTSEPPSSASSDVEQVYDRAETVTPIGGRPTSRLSRATTATSTADSFQTAREVPLGTDDEDDDQHAIDALRSSSVAVDRAGSSASQRAKSPASFSFPQQPPPPTINAGGEDVLRDALGPRPVTSPVFNESLQERLDRVLARVKEEKARRAASPAGSRPRSYISAAGSGSATPSGRLSPAAMGQANGRISPQLNGRAPSSLSTGRRSPFGASERGRDSPSIDQILQQSPRSGVSPPTRSSSRHGHGKQPSIASLASTLSTEQPSTPVTGGSTNPGGSFTPAASASSNRDPTATAAAAPAPRIMYRIDDFGYDKLEAIVQSAALPRPRTRQRDEALEGLFGREFEGGEGELHPEVKEVFEAPRRAFADLDARLDALLLELVAV